MESFRYLVGLSTFTEFGPRRLKVLLEYFGSAKKIWQLNYTELLAVGLNEKIASGFVSHRKNFSLDEYFRRLKNLGINAFTINDELYPYNLRNTQDAPVVIYVRGSIKKEDRNSVAIVGTRTMTSYGKEVAQKFAGELAGSGLTVVSGLALGIDACAQKSAIDAGGRSIAVLASGADIITPATNRSLAMNILRGRGALVTERPLGYIPRPFDFPLRDRLIAGLSKSVVVVEGKSKSGTFYTVQAALEQGKTVYAVPGPINSPTSAGPNYLITTGARPALNTSEIIEELGGFRTPIGVNAGGCYDLDASDLKIYNILESEPLHLDEIVRISGITTSDVSARLTIMEMKGIVKNMGEGVYKKN